MANPENLHFVRGQILKPSDLNSINEGIVRLAEAYQISIDQIGRFENGQILGAQPLNTLRNRLMHLTQVTPTGSIWRRGRVPADPHGV